MDYKDYYAVLGVPRTATQDEIKKAFRKAARKHHPDTNKGAAAERAFKDVNEANAVLSDPKKRQLYDRLGKDWESYARAGATAGAGSGGSPFAGYRPASGPGGVRYEFRASGDGGDFSDFFNAFFSGAAAEAAEPPEGSPGRGRRPTGGMSFDDILAGMGLHGSAGNGGSSTRQPAAGRARPGAEATAEITLDEAYRGTTRRIEIDGKRLEITIPPGADTGTRIRLAGKAPGGGDLHVVVKQLPDPVFTRRGADLERDLPLTLGEALLGGEVPVRTPKGRILLTIPPGTQPGRTFRLTGRGMPRVKGTGHGDVLVRTRVVLPTDLDDETRNAARRFIDRLDQPDPRTRET